MQRKGNVSGWALASMGLLFLAALGAGAAHAQGGVDYLSGADTKKLMSPAERAVTLVATGERYLAKAEREGAELAAGQGGPKQARRVAKEYERALRAFEQALGKDSRNQPAWRGKGVALLGLERPEEALQVCTRALELAPLDEEAALCQFSARLGAERFELAFLQLDTARFRRDPLMPKLEARVTSWLSAHPSHARRGEIAGWLERSER